MIKTQKDYQAHDDLHVLKRHAEIVSDKSRHTAAKSLAKKEVSHLQKIATPKAPAKRK